jgi:hypothetical protein
MPTEVWLLITAIIFTIVGYRMGQRNTIELTIDSLIEQGYLRTKGKGKELEIIKWNHLGQD